MSKAKSKESWGAGQVVSVLENKHFTAPAHAILREVRNGTGYGRQDRSADALVISLWPSRGIWFGGVEVKVARSDWQRELKDPEKSAEIQKWCDYWWVAAPEGVVLEGEVPETWGWIEVSKGKTTVRKSAPKLTAEALSTKFVAAILRRQCDSVANMRGSILRELKAEMSYEPQPDELELKRQIVYEKRQREFAELQLAAHKKRIHEYAVVSGINIMDSYSVRPSGKTVELAERLMGGGYGRRLTDLANELVNTAELIRGAQAESLLEPVKMDAGDGGNVANDGTERVA
jgi:hypothetical protein